MTFPAPLLAPVRRVLLAALLLPAATVRADDAREIRFQVAPGISAHAELMEDERLAVETSQGGGRQLLEPSTDAEGGYRLSHADYNFDGFQDLAASATLGQVNEVYSVYLYVPATGRFRALAAPTGPEISCEGLWTLSPDPLSRTLSSSCRSGPMWYSDVYRYQGDRLYLYRSMRGALVETSGVSRVLSLDRAEDMGILVVWSTWDASGKRLERALWNAFDPPLHDAPMKGWGASVVPARLPLYSRAGDTATRRYLVNGDRVELLDEADGWLQVRYHNPSRGPVLGWVNVPDPE